MPQVPDSTPTATRTFAGLEFTVPMPFAEGHQLSSGEASWLNSNLASVIGNAYSGDIRRAEAAKKGSTKTWDHAAKFAAKYEGYVLGESNRGSGGVKGTDAVAALARVLATIELKRKLVAAGHKPGALMKVKNTEGVSKFNELLDALIARDGEHFTAQAQAQIADMDTQPEDDLFAGLTDTTEVEAPAAA